MYIISKRVLLEVSLKILLLFSLLLMFVLTIVSDTIKGDNYS